MEKNVEDLDGYKGDIEKNGKTVFENWVDVDEDRKIARSSSPNYTGADNSQNMDDTAVQYLKDKSIKRVISFNELELSDLEKGRLTNAGIEYYHFGTKDFTAATKEQLTAGAEKIQQGNALVYCGAGIGRTGTQITAWEIIYKIKEKDKAINESTAEKPDQKNVLLQLNPV